MLARPILATIRAVDILHLVGTGMSLGGATVALAGHVLSSRCLTIHSRRTRLTGSAKFRGQPHLESHIPETTVMFYTVSRGDEPGAVLMPHLHGDGKYVASMTRFERDYIRVESLRELEISGAQHGFCIRMSCPSSTIIAHQVLCHRLP
jgi:hypothetical protein